MSLSEENEIAKLLSDLESDRTERKSSASDRSKIRRTICAFANDLPNHGKPGFIFIGANNDGSCSGLQITDEMLTQLSNMRSSGAILPPPSMIVQKKTISGCDMVVMRVEPSDQAPVRYEGRVWVRVGSTLSVATPEEERRLAEKRRSADLPFDYRPCMGAGINDLDMMYFEKNYLPAAVAQDVLEQNERTPSQRLLSLRFLDRNDVPTNGAILTLGKDPRAFIPSAYVQFLRIEGVNLTDPVKDEKALSGPLCEVLPKLDELLEINISTAVDLTSEKREIRSPDYPVNALRQLARNALMHRSYENTNAPAKIYWFSDRVEMQNPGGLFGQVNQQNFGKGATDYRNPLVAEAMKVLGYVQKFGMGIPIAKKELLKNGNPGPEFVFEPAHFLVIVRRSR